MNPLLLILAILPGILVCVYIYTRDEHDREPHSHLVISFALGVAAAFPAMYLEKLGVESGIEESENVFWTIVFAFVVVALAEELVKFLALMLYAYPRKAFNEPMDGIVYAVMIAMGFATFENILYAELFGLETTILRAFTAVPAHACFAVVMGYFVGLSKFDQSNRIWLIFKGFLFAILLHGAYDFFLLQENIPALTLVSIVMLVMSVVYGKKLIQQHIENSPFKQKEILAVTPTVNTTVETDDNIITTDDIWENILKEDLKNDSEEE